MKTYTLQLHNRDVRTTVPFESVGIIAGRCVPVRSKKSLKRVSQSVIFKRLSLSLMFYPLSVLGKLYLLQTKFVFDEGGGSVIFLMTVYLTSLSIHQII